MTKRSISKDRGTWSLARTFRNNSNSCAFVPATIRPNCFSSGSHSMPTATSYCLGGNLNTAGLRYLRCRQNFHLIAKLCAFFRISSLIPSLPFSWPNRCRSLGYRLLWQIRLEEIQPEEGFGRKFGRRTVK